ncbi:M20/M25/M40 family metallo-hydrolase [Salidesulfovibrio onnuriiensis]|uniref:M20/M25/M40 family metallo-hydrolase n=1 Tax=Salidesulfovibrio onnuriiensis TaxID=2583823 RepID=UPI0011CAED90|nr:M20/M25/M40 family metallo-hydrolase [Salidesulfovibrio onnuriiensis]
MLDKERLLKNFLDMVRIDSPSFKEAAMADYLTNFATERRWLARVDNAGKLCNGETGNVIVRIQGTGPGEAIAFSAHMDCVPPCLGVKPVVNGDIVSSEGETVLGGDDKAGIAAILEAAMHLEEEKIPHPDLYLLFTIAEESGMHGAKNMASADLPVTEVVVSDSGGPIGATVVKAPAKAGITITFHGKPAHAGMEPEKGVSAIQLAADAIRRMTLLRIDEETTANLGHIEGGTVTNIVAETCTLTAEARSLDDAKLKKQLEHMEQCCDEAAAAIGGSIDFTYEISYPALTVPEDSPLLEKTSQCCEKLGLAFDGVPCGGGSDANILFGKGYSVINISNGMKDVHTTKESISMKDVHDAARLMAEMMKSPE